MPPSLRHFHLCYQHPSRKAPSLDSWSELPFILSTTIDHPSHRYRGKQNKKCQLSWSLHTGPRRKKSTCPQKEKRVKGRNPQGCPPWACAQNHYTPLIHLCMIRSEPRSSSGKVKEESRKTECQGKAKQNQNHFTIVRLLFGNVFFCFE